MANLLQKVKQGMLYSKAKLWHYAAHVKDSCGLYKKPKQARMSTALHMIKNFATPKTDAPKHHICLPALFGVLWSLTQQQY